MIEREYTSDVTADRSGEQVAVAGRVHDVRDLGGIVFLILRDARGELQVVFKEEDDADLFERVQELNREAVVRIEGEVTASDQAPGGVEMVPDSLEVISESTTPLPMEVSKDVDANLDTRLDQRFMDLRKPEVRAVFSLRSKLLAGMTAWFDEEGFTNVDTPLLSQAGAEGGADLFPVLYYDKEAFLSQSPQLYKQILMGADFDRIYEVGKAFRAEDFGTSRHVSEIGMFDVELSYIEDHDDVMDVQEDSLRASIEYATEHAQRELDVLEVDPELPDERFPRISFSEARSILETEYDHVPEDADDLDTKGEKLLGEYFEEQGHPAFFVVGFPNEKFYYMQDVPGDDIASRKFDLIYRGQEISSGGQREHDYERLLQRMEEDGVDPESFDFYLDAFEYGMPPHGGYGLGIDRLVQKVADLDNIREAILFPRDPERLTP
ncbi:aspartate--tRNA(Asn) ligase [Halobacteriales archaeon QS_1_68_20]|nr:MAG: aspartate--tRNA(Asn) ligase [Halobacteriales archaeon QS_1_68_20]